MFPKLRFLLLIAVELISCSPQRPLPSPFPALKPYTPSPPTNRSCTVATPKPAAITDSVTVLYDSGPDILNAVELCNPGGEVIFEKDQTYSIGTALNLTNLQNVDLNIKGTIKFTDDIDYWVANAFKHSFQNISTFWIIGGNEVNVYGGGTIDGTGETWWSQIATNATINADRPALFGYFGFYGGSVSNLTLLQPPNWFHFVGNSSNVLFDGMNMSARGNGPNAAQNSDGWDTYRSDNIIIQNSIIENGDDCVSFKPNSTNILVQGLHCNGSHGISVGSLGQYVGEIDIVENIFVYNTSLTNASDGARVKVWPGISPAQIGLNGVGGGQGFINNVTYDIMFNDNNLLDIEINQCYEAISTAACDEFPSNMTISNIHFNNFWGIGSAANDPKVGSIICSNPEVCTDIFTLNVSVVPPSGEAPEYVCTNVNVTELGLPCIT